MAEAEANTPLGTGAGSTGAGSTDRRVRRVLVLCTGNSCRSIMGEAIINSMAGFEAASAGSTPVGWVHPKALETLKRNALPTISATNQPLYKSQSWDEFATEAFHTIITVCDNAADEVCPVMAGVSDENRVQRVHWSIPDPANVDADADGSDDAVDRAFQQAFDLLSANIATLFADLPIPATINNTDNNTDNNSAGVS